MGWFDGQAESLYLCQGESLCWVVVSKIFYFHPYLGKWSNLTFIFQMGWNHQLVYYVMFFVGKKVVVHYFSQSSDVPRTSSWCICSHIMMKVEFFGPRGNHQTSVQIKTTSAEVTLNCGDCKGRVLKIRKNIPEWRFRNHTKLPRLMLKWMVIILRDFPFGVCTQCFGWCHRMTPIFLELNETDSIHV